MTNLATGPNASENTLAAYKLGQSKWERDPPQYACKAYTTARQELNILIHLKHSHIVPLVGISVNPLAIVLDLAPQGALDQRLKHYQRSGDKLTAKAIQQVVLQIARHGASLFEFGGIFCPGQYVFIVNFTNVFHSNRLEFATIC